MHKKILQLAHTLGILTLGGLTLIVAAASGRAQILPDVKNGQQLAERICSSCHIVGENASGTVKADVPTFRAIANKPDQTAEQIVSRIMAPHEPMPEIQLTRREIENLAAYILTFRESK